MYIRPEQIAEQYEMEVKSISKGRECFLCETDFTSEIDSECAH